MATYVFDPWAKKTPDELKDDCRRLSHALDNWQMIAMDLAERSPDAVKTLPPRCRGELENLIAAYKD